MTLDDEQWVAKEKNEGVDAKSVLESELSTSHLSEVRLRNQVNQLQDQLVSARSNGFGGDDSRVEYRNRFNSLVDSLEGVWDELERIAPLYQQKLIEWKRMGHRNHLQRMEILKLKAENKELKEKSEKDQERIKLEEKRAHEAALARQQLSLYAEDLERQAARMMTDIELYKVGDSPLTEQEVTQYNVDEGEGVLSSQNEISRRLVLYHDVWSLQAQNKELLNSCRLLASKSDQGEEANAKALEKIASKDEEISQLNSRLVAYEEAIAEAARKLEKVLSKYYSVNLELSKYRQDEDLSNTSIMSKSTSFLGGDKERLLLERKEAEAQWFDAESRAQAAEDRCSKLTEELTAVRDECIELTSRLENPQFQPNHSQDKATSIESDVSKKNNFSEYVRRWRARTNNAAQEDESWLEQVKPPSETKAKSNYLENRLAGVWEFSSDANNGARGDVRPQPRADESQFIEDWRNERARLIVAKEEAENIAREATARYDEIKELYETAKTECSKLSERILQMRISKARSDDEINAKQQQLATKDAELKRTQVELANAVAAQRSAEQSVSRSASEIRTLEDKLRSQVQATRGTSEEVRKLREELNKVSSDARAKIQESRLSQEKLEAQLTHQESQVASAVSEEIRQLNSELERITAEAQAQQEAANSRQQALEDRLRQQEAQAATDTSSEVVEQLKAELDRVTHEARAEAQTAADKLKALEEKLSDQEALAADGRSDEVKRLQTELEQVTASARNEINEAAKKQAQLEAQLKQQEGLHAIAIAEEVQRLRSELDTATAQTNTEREAAAEMKQALEVLEAKLKHQEAQEANNQASDEVQRLKADLSKEQHEVTMIRDELDGLNEELERTRSVLREVKEELQESRVEKDRAIEESRRSDLRSRLKIKQLQDANSKLSSACETLGNSSDFSLKTLPSGIVTTSSPVPMKKRKTMASHVDSDTSHLSSSLDEREPRLESHFPTNNLGTEFSPGLNRPKLVRIRRSSSVGGQEEHPPTRA